MSRRGTTQMYRHLDASLLRASAHLADVVPRAWPDIHDDAQIEACCGWLAEVWDQKAVREAVTVASPALADRVQSICDGSRPDADRIRRLMLAVARYLVRMRGRATPFGLFAGVAPLRFDEHASARWGPENRVRVQTDPVWLAAAIARLESYRGVRRLLTVVVNDMVFVRGDRLILPWGSGPDVARAATEVSVRHSPPVRMIVELTRTPLAVCDLAERLCDEFPDTSATVVDATVAELIGCGALITCLRPPSVVADKVGHVLRQLQQAGAHDVPEATAITAELTDAYSRITRGSRSDRTDGPAKTTTSGSKQARARPVGASFTADLALGCSTILPGSVAHEAAKAAGALARLSRDRIGHPGWREYHSRFLDRYGPGGTVPLALLLDPTTGLGYPRHFGQASTRDRRKGTCERDERLLVLAQQSALDGAREIVLDEGLLDTLAKPPPGWLEQVWHPPHIDICMEVRAPTTTLLEAGAFTLAVIGIGRTGIATSGRFLDILGDEDVRRMTSAYGHLPVAVEGAMVAQLSFRPEHPRVEHVAQVPPVLRDVLSVGEYPRGPAASVTVRDLAVTADHQRMYLLSMSRRQVVEPVVASALAGHTMPPVVRLMTELPRATSGTVTLFDWGVADCLPFRPRIRYGRSILSVARWRLDPADLPGRSTSRRRWTADLAALRERLDLPVSISVGTGDRRLRLNLEEPMDTDLLRAHLDRAPGPVTIAEAPTEADHGWIGGRAHEIAVPMATTARPAPPPASLASGLAMTVIGPEHGEGRDSSVLSARIACHPDLLDAIIIRHLPTPCVPQLTTESGTCLG